jgi:hypothetical protein
MRELTATASGVTEPDAAPTADRAKTSARPQGAVRLKPAGNGLPQGSRCPENTRKTLASNQFHRSEGTNPPVETHPYAEFQQVPRSFPKGPRHTLEPPRCKYEQRSRI